MKSLAKLKAYTPWLGSPRIPWLLLFLAFGFYIGYKILLAGVGGLLGDGSPEYYSVNFGVVWPLYVSIFLMLLFSLPRSYNHKERDLLTHSALNTLFICGSGYRKKDPVTYSALETRLWALGLGLKKSVSPYIRYLKYAFWPRLFSLSALCSIIVASFLSGTVMALEATVATENFITLGMIFAFVSVFKRIYELKGEKLDELLLKPYALLFVGSCMLVSVFVGRTIVETRAFIVGMVPNDGGYGIATGILVGLIILSGVLVVVAEIYYLGRIRLRRMVQGQEVQQMRGVEIVSTISTMTVFILGAVAFSVPGVLSEMLTTYDSTFRIIYEILILVVLATTFTATSLLFTHRTRHQSSLK